MGGALARHLLHAFVPQGPEIDAAQEMLPRPEQDRANGQVELVDQAGAQILPDRRHAAAHPDILPAGRGPRLRQRGVDALGDESELRAAGHPERRPRVMGQHEDGRVIRRLVAPPALPAVVRPGTANGAEHVAPENPGPDSREALLRHLVVDTGLAVPLPVHLPEHARGEEPLHQLGSVDAERMLEVLSRPGPVPVDRDPEALHADFRHDAPRWLAAGCGAKDGATETRGRSGRGRRAPHSRPVHSGFQATSHRCPSGSWK